MTYEDAQKLKHGLYRFHWADNEGTSLAVVGSLDDGSRWFACANWTHGHIEGIASYKWYLVERAELIEEVK